MNDFNYIPVVLNPDGPPPLTPLKAGLGRLVRSFRPQRTPEEHQRADLVKYLPAAWLGSHSPGGKSVVTLVRIFDTMPLSDQQLISALRPVHSLLKKPTRTVVSVDGVYPWKHGQISLADAVKVLAPNGRRPRVGEFFAAVEE